MKKVFLVTCCFVLLCCTVLAQGGKRFVNRVFNEIQSLKEIPYGAAAAVGDDEPETLYFDFYEPAEDTMSARPLVITVFGGAFVAGNRGWSDMVAIADTLSHYGYAVASIDYRLLPVLKLSGDNFIRTAYMAAQDISSAVRFFKGNAEKYRIDPSQIFLLGNSAGTIASLHFLYFGDDQRPEATYLEPDLGGVHTSGSPQYLDYSPSVAGVVAQWGCLLDTNLVDPYETTPVCLLHGTADKTVPYYSGVPYEEKLGSFLTGFLPTVYGSFFIERALTRYGIDHEFHTFIGEEHAFYLDGFSTIVPEKLDTCLKIAIRFMAKYNRYLNDEVSIKNTDNQTVNIYPNPVSDFLEIELPEGVTDFSYTIYDVSGRKISKGTYNKNISVKMLKSGVYFIDIQDDNLKKKYKSKFVKY